MSQIPARLSIGEERASIEIHARSKWNPTGILVSPGERYTLRAEGEWIDGGIHTDADGFPSERAPALSRWLLRAFESRRRVPAENWFCLIGSVGPGLKTAFHIGQKRAEWIVDTDGELMCFANDVSFAYWNNKGSVRLAVTRLA